MPLLAKGFFSTEEQLLELREAGADAALLILRDLDDATAARLMRYAEGIGLDTLVEAHDEDELERAHRLNAPIIGVNARDLSTFRIDRAAQLELVARAAGDVVIAESAVHSRAQGAAAELAGADAVLVGTSLMQAADPGAKLRELALAPAREGLRPDAPGGRRRRGRGGRRHARVHLRGGIPAPRAGRARRARHRAVGRRVRRRAGGARRRPRSALHARGGQGARATTPLLMREGEPVARVADLPWEGSDPEHWEKARGEGRIVLAGGLGPENVRAAIEAVHPWAVDAASSLETEPGIKDHARVRAFIEEAR